MNPFFAWAPQCFRRFRFLRNNNTRPFIHAIAIFVVRYFNSAFKQYVQRVMGEGSELHLIPYSFRVETRNIHEME